jgi:hypothetical protein
MEAKLEAKMDGLKEEIMEVLKNFIFREDTWLKSKCIP